jgi:integrase
MQPELELYLSSIRSEHTRHTYPIYFRKYCEFLHKLGIDDIFLGGDPIAIQNKIIEFINYMKSQGKGYSTIHNYASAVLAFYKINDVILNVSKINKFIPPVRKVTNDRHYTHEEISKLLEISDVRLKVMILLMASAGIRQGAIPTLRLRDLQDRKLTVYEGDSEEYFTFITPECRKAIDSYLDMRKRYGEVLTPESYLVRERFDVNDQFRIPRAKPVSILTIKWKMIDIAKRAGVRSKEVKASHSFRKFFTTQLINSKVNPEIREMLLGHRIGLASCYYRPTEEEMFAEYEKAENSLTIDPTQRLQKKVQLLEAQEKNYEKLDAKIDALARKFFENNTLLGGPEGVGRKPTQEEIDAKISWNRMKRQASRKAENQLQAEL